jgi:hypothetical protein
MILNPDVFSTAGDIFTRYMGLKHTSFYSKHGRKEVCLNETLTDLGRFMYWFE